ncbi:MAG: radical SAM protein, partial [SAR324 cluster bacterium]|nr:radical SAM protein [SAR324 cluster bacterium]
MEELKFVREQYSVYNAHLDKDWMGHPLKHILPENPEEGWPARRSLKRPLNHLELLQRKETIAFELDLHSTRTPVETFDPNYQLLQLHQQGKLSTAAVIGQLEAHLQSRGAAASRKRLKTLLREYATVGSMEFHPSDLCNLACTGCTYGHDDPLSGIQKTQFPFKHISDIAALNPRGIMIVGGGEPVLYRSGEYRFQEMVDELHGHLPDTLLALKTNGTFIPRGNWPTKVRWVRISLDAATHETFRKVRGKPLFGLVMSNFLKYLNTGMEYVGVSFLFSKLNIHEYADVAALVFHTIKTHKPESLGRVGIEYRPLR